MKEAEIAATDLVFLHVLIHMMRLELASAKEMYMRLIWLEFIVPAVNIIEKVVR